MHYMACLSKSYPVRHLLALITLRYKDEKSHLLVTSPDFHRQLFNTTRQRHVELEILSRINLFIFYLYLEVLVLYVVVKPILLLQKKIKHLNKDDLNK